MPNFFHWNARCADIPLPSFKMNSFGLVDRDRLMTRES
jgi:hypothetical protein